MWNPARDPFVAKRYQSSNLDGKATCRNVLLAQLGLDKNPTGPVYLLDFAAGHDGRYLELLAARLDQLLADDVRLVALGAFPGDSAAAAVTFQIAARKYPTRLALAPTVDDRLTHLAVSGADFQLFPGRTLHLSEDILRSLKYGTVPIVPAGPGVAQLITDFQPGVAGGNGLVFYRPDGEALFDALAHRAPKLLQQPAEDWESLQQQAMIQAGKFTWARTAAQLRGALSTAQAVSRPLPGKTVRASSMLPALDHRRARAAFARELARNACGPPNRATSPTWTRSSRSSGSEPRARTSGTCRREPLSST